VTQLALANPRVHLRLLANGRVLLNAPAGAGLRERVGALYGFGLATRLLDVAGEGAGARVAGVVAPPALSRTHRDDIHFIVNGRVVRDTLLTQALLEAYRPLLPRDQFPLAALELLLDPSEVDVNVHPAKTWVRFRRPRVLYGVVLDAVRTALRQMDAAPAGLVARVAGDEAGPGGTVFPSPGLGGSPDSAGWAGGDPAQATLFREGEAGYRSEPFFGRVVGQIEDTFIVAHTADEVFFVDQHVAHERVLFERLRGELERGTLASQELLFPQPLELAPARLRALERVTPSSRASGSRSRDSEGGRSSCGRFPRSSGPRISRGLPTSSRRSSTRTRGRGAPRCWTGCSRSSRAALRSRPTRRSLRRRWPRF
jgi:DNA mismatch repair protein MutL